MDNEDRDFFESFHVEGVPREFLNSLADHLSTLTDEELIRKTLTVNLWVHSRDDAEFEVFVKTVTRRVRANMKKKRPPG